MPIPEPRLDVVSGTATERFVCGQPGDRILLALVFKRACRIEANGLCTVLDEPVPIEDDSIPADPDLAAPFVSPPLSDSDLFAFKPATDVVIQGHAYTYHLSRFVDAEVRIGPLIRTVRVHGDRAMAWSGGRVIFSAPEPFDRIPLTYDRAYGGVDTVALSRLGDPLSEGLQAAQPDYADDLARSTQFHYPRNPSGCGYLMEVDRESVEAARVPNTEFPFDPVSPDRLAVGSPRGWLKAPLPAGFDWYHATWFPRMAYIGRVHEHDPVTEPVAECANGWAPPDILNLAGRQFVFFDTRFQQGAPPGLWIPDLPPDADLHFRNLFPSHPERRIQLPGLLPRVRIHLSARDGRDAQIRLNTVLIQPDANRVVLVFAALCEVGRKYGPHEMADMTWSID